MRRPLVLMSIAVLAAIPAAALAAASPPASPPPIGAPSAAAVPASTPGASTSPAAPSAKPAFSPQPPAQVDPAVTLRAKELFRRLQTGTLDRSQLSRETNKELTDALVKRAAAELGPLGEPLEFKFVSRETRDIGTGYVYRVVCKSVTIIWLFAIDPGDKVVGLIYGAAH